MRKREGKTIKNIREAVRQGKLQEQFSAQDVNAVLGIHWAGNFLPKHRAGNPGGFAELFVRISEQAGSLSSQGSGSLLLVGYVRAVDHAIVGVTVKAHRRYLLGMLIDGIHIV